MTNKQLLQLALQEGFTSIRRGKKHEILEKNGFRLTLSRGGKPKSWGAVSATLGMIRKAGLKDKPRKEEEMQTIKDSWPKVEEPAKLSAKDLVKKLYQEGKGFGEMATILNTMGVTHPTTGKLFIPITMRRFCEENIEDVPKTARGFKKGHAIGGHPKPDEKRAYMPQGEKDAEITLKVVENILTVPNVPNVPATKRLTMVKNFLQNL